MATFKKVKAGEYKAEHNGRTYHLKRGTYPLSGKKSWEIDNYSGWSSTLQEAQYCLNFIVLVDDYLQEIGAKFDTGLERWILETPLGELGISVWSDSIVTRFQDVDRADLPSLPGPTLNRYSGKWNFHWSDTKLDQSTGKFEYFKVCLGTVLNKDT